MTSPLPQYPETPLTRGVKELMDAAPEYEKAEAYYNGEVEEIFANANIERYIGKTRNRYRLNFAKMIVNTLADRVEIASVVVPSSEPLTKLLNKLYKKNRMHRKSRTIHRRTTMFGDSYLFVWPENPDQPTIKFEVHYNNPKTTRAIYDREHPDKVAYVIKMWKEPSPLGPLTWRANLYFPDQIEKYIATITNATTTSTTYYPNPYDPNAPSMGDDGHDAPSLDPDRWDEQETLPNPFKRIPIFHFRNDEPYGKPRHKDAYGAQDAINKLSTTLVHNTDFQGFPQRYGLAEPGAQLGGESDSSQPWTDEDSAADDRDSQVESGPGTFIRLQGIRAAGSFPASTPDGFIDPAKFYLRSMAQITTTPLRFLDPMGEPPSGEALRAMDAPLNKEAVDFEDILEETWADVYEFMLSILGKMTNLADRAKTDPDDPDGDMQVDVQWKPVTSIDDAMGWETIQKKIKAGVPPRQALMESGYSKQQVDSWIKGNENRSLLDHDSDILTRIAASARDLSAAVQQKILDPGIAQHILTSLLNKLLNEKLEEPKIKEQPIVQPINNPPPPDPNNPQNPQEGKTDGPVLDGRPPGTGPDGGSASAETVRRLAPVSH